MISSRRMAFTRAFFALGGVLLLLRGGYIALDTIRSDQWPEILIWLAAGIVVHDVVIAPLTLLLGRLLHPGPVIAAGWAGVGVVLLLTYPLLKGAEVRQNPTVIPHPPGQGLLQSLAVVALGMLLAWAVRRVRAHRRDRADRTS